MKICNYENCTTEVKFKPLCYRHAAKVKREAMRRELIDMLGGCCSGCGSTGRLEFDHIDPSTRVDSIGTMLGHRREKVIEEALKCQLLCKPCHRVKSANELRESGKAYMQRKGSRTCKLIDFAAIARMDLRDIG